MTIAREVDGDASAFVLLLVEDNPDGGLLLEQALAAEPGFSYRVVQVDRIAHAAEAYAREKVDVVVLDLGLAESQGLETLSAARMAMRDAPIVVLTGNDNEAVGLEAVHAGALDYLVKGQESARTIARALRYAKERHAHVEEIRRANANLEHQLDDRLRELAQAQEKAARNDRMAAIGTIAAGVAHELNSPLMGVMNHIQYTLAKLPSSAEHLRSVLGAGLDHARRCAAIIEALLAHARVPASGRDAGTFSVTGDVRNALAAARADLQEVLEARCLRVETNVHEPLPAVTLDQGSLDIVMRNLLQNACDATEGMPAPSVRIAARHVSDRDEIEVVVEDNGRGIDPNVLTRVFEPLYTTKRGRGNGLGLALCRRLVEGVGGRICASNDAVRGTVFAFVLPAAARTIRGSSQGAPR